MQSYKNLSTKNRIDLLLKLENEFKNLTFEEIKIQLATIMSGLEISTPVFNQGLFLYRARKIDPLFNVSKPIKLEDLKYPPASRARIGRANREGCPMFYCSMSKEPLFFEIPKLEKNDEIIISIWKTKTKLLVNNIGYSREVFSELKSKRKPPTWIDGKNGKSSIFIPLGDYNQLNKIITNDENEYIKIELSRLFMKKIEEDAEFYYKLTSAIAESHLGKINEVDKFDGIMYPSVRMWANSDNIALFPQFVDNYLQFTRAIRVRIDSLNPTGFDISNIDCAREIDESGALRWLGRRLNWKIPPGCLAKITLTEGTDSDGDYSSDKNGVPCHWVVIDERNGKLIEPR